MTHLSKFSTRLTQAMLSRMGDVWTFLTPVLRLIFHMFALVLACASVTGPLFGILSIAGPALYLEEMSFLEFYLRGMAAGVLGLVAILSGILVCAQYLTTYDQWLCVRELFRCEEANPTPEKPAVGDCIELVSTEMRAFLGYIEEAVYEALEVDEHVTLEAMVGILRRHAQLSKCEAQALHADECHEGQILSGIAEYLNALYHTRVRRGFDRAVASGACPVTLIQQLLGWSQAN